MSFSADDAPRADITERGCALDLVRDPALRWTLHVSQKSLSGKVEHGAEVRESVRRMRRTLEDGASLDGARDEDEYLRANAAQEAKARIIADGTRWNINSFVYLFHECYREQLLPGRRSDLNRAKNPDRADREAVEAIDEHTVVDPFGVDPAEMDWDGENTILHRWISRLAPAQREFVALLVEGMTAAEASREIGRSEAWGRQVLKRVRDKLPLVAQQT
jgi:DNA-directed RNA polymerase specialized sigma24 family protein